MTNFAGWISPAVLLALGWTLLHFVWQGVGLTDSLRAGGGHVGIDDGLAGDHFPMAES
jgi:hypothetical protein